MFEFILFHLFTFIKRLTVSSLYYSFFCILPLINHFFLYNIIDPYRKKILHYLHIDAWEDDKILTRNYTTKTWTDTSIPDITTFTVESRTSVVNTTARIILDPSSYVSQTFISYFFLARLKKLPKNNTLKRTLIQRAGTVLKSLETINYLRRSRVSNLLIIYVEAFWQNNKKN